MNTREKYKSTDFINNKIGKLTITKYSGTKNKKKGDNHKYWMAKCDCGNILYLKGNQIKNKSILSCRNCASKTHGKTNTRLFNIWQSMKGRCYNKNNQDYYNYGQKGIIVCNEWKDNFIDFYNWAIDNGYNDNLSIDRIDVFGNYEPNNCRWADNITQANNKKNNTHYIYKDKKYTIRDLCNISGYSYHVIQSRLYAGWDIEKILNYTPKYGNNQFETKKILCLETGQIYESISDASNKTGARKTGIWAVCNKRAKTTIGLHFEYYEK